MRAPRGKQLEAAWNRRFEDYAAQLSTPGRGVEASRRGSAAAGVCVDAESALAAAAAKRETVATRKASQLALEALAPALPELLGGSADLTGSNLTKWNAAKPLRADALDGRHINYGVREFGMSAIANGIALHGGYHPVRRHLPRLFRLRAQRRAHGGADEAARHLSSSRMTRSASAKTGRRTRPSSTRPACD